MASLAEVRQKHPEYNDLSDQQLADALHKKFYADIPKDQFYGKVGLKAAQPPQAKPKRSFLGAMADLDREAGGALANFTRGTGVMDEVSALGPAVRNVIGGELNPMKAYSKGLAEVRASEDDFATRRPLAASALKGTGMGSTLFIPGGAMTQAGANAGRVGSIARAATVAGTQSALYGAADRGTARERLGAASAGAVVGAGVGGALGAVASRAAKPKAPRVKAPTLDELQSSRDAAYKAVDQSGATFTPQAYDDLVGNIRKTLDDATIDPDLHPDATAALRMLERRKGQELSVTKLDQLRQVIRDDVAGSAKKGERRLGKKIVGAIDDFIANVQPGQIAGGDAAQASAAIPQARDLHSRISKIEAVEGAVAEATQRTGSTGSGGNIDNAIRQELRKMLKKQRNLTPDERKLLNEIVMGGRGQNALRLAGKLSPSGNGLMAAGNLAAAATAGPLGAIPGAIGMGAKYAADRMTQGKVLQLVKLMAAGGRRGLAAEEQLATMARADPAVAEIYSDVAVRLGRTGGLTAANQ